MKNKLMIIGAGGHGRVLARIAEMTMNYSEISFLDDADIKVSGEYPVVGKVSGFPKYIHSHDFFVAFGDNALRKKYIESLMKNGANIINLIHPSAVIDKNVSLGKGVAVIAGAIINCGTTIGNGAIINTASSVDHDCIIGDYVHIAIGARIAGEVKIGEQVFIGASVSVIPDITICAGCVVGAGAVVVKNLLEKGTYIGIPAKLK